MDLTHYVPYSLSSSLSTQTHAITQPLGILRRMNVSGFTMEPMSSFELKNLCRIMLNMQLIPLPDF